MIPLTIIAAPALGRWRVALAGTAVIGALPFALNLATERDDLASAYLVARALAANDEGKCPYVLAGDSILYYLARACLPTACTFPPTLAYAPEQAATEIDEAGEMQRIMARATPGWWRRWTIRLRRGNRGSLAVTTAALAHDYRLVLSAPRNGGHWLVYFRRDHVPKR